MMSERLDSAIAYGFLLTIAFTALAHGAVEPWSMAIFEMLIVLLILLWSVKCVVDQKLKLKVPITFWPIAAFFLYGWIQSVSRINSAGQISSLSFDPEASRNAAFVLFFLLVSHLIAANFFAEEPRIQTLAKFLTVFGLVLSVLSLIQYFTKESFFHWSNPANGAGGMLSGPFVNHNHFSGYIELILPLPIALVVTGAVPRLRALYGFAAVIMAVAVIFSGSRGGLISFTAGLIFLAVCGLAYNRSKNLDAKRDGSLEPGGTTGLTSLKIFQNAAPVVLIIIAIVAGVLWFGSEPVVDRITDNDLIRSDDNAQTFEGSRGWIWKNSMSVFRNNPIYGTGIGSFETAFPHYAEGYPATDDGSSLIWTRAHNDYIQVLTDTGLIGGILTVLFIVALGITIRRALAQKNRFLAGTAIGCGAAILSLLVHSVFDFNLQLPSTSLLFLTLIAATGNLAPVKTESRR